MLKEMREYDIYKDIEKRCNGEIYIGVVGPVRTGKSTFIKSFMEKMIIPNMENQFEKERAIDELPQSANGKTITTTEPKFIPSKAAQVSIGDDIQMKIRLIDCVGYMVDGAVGHMENGKDRMVSTPWSEEDIPFSKAAEIGTDKCINEHSTIGLVITTDGTIVGLGDEMYAKAEEKTINTLKDSGKPFIVLINSKEPNSQLARNKLKNIEDKYNVVAVTLDCSNITNDDIKNIFENILYEFPIGSIEFKIPGWMKALENDNPIKISLISSVKDIMNNFSSMRDMANKQMDLACEYIKGIKIDSFMLENGNILISLEANEASYYDYISEIYGSRIEDEQVLIGVLRDYSKLKDDYVKVKDALEMVKNKGYGVVLPGKGEIVLNEPEIIKHGNRYGVKIRAISPSIHMIKADIETEIAPIVGSKEQAEDLIKYIKTADENKEIWDTNIFGKTVEQMVRDGISTKILAIGDECQLKLQDTMQKVVNDMEGGLICIII